jgi:riboflavin synthase
MFTGLIEQIGRVVSAEIKSTGCRLIVQAQFDAIQVGESIAVNGVCLTVLSDFKCGEIAFDVSPETLDKTAIGELQSGDCVNLERAMLASSRFGGHFVTGHVDCTARVMAITPFEEYTELAVGDFKIKPDLFLVQKGSIALDGVSLTINSVENNVSRIMLIPHTLENTVLGQKRLGMVLNVEFDYITRIVAHQQRVTQHVCLTD